MPDDRRVQLRACARPGRDDLEGQALGRDPRLVEKHLQACDQLAVVDHPVGNVDRGAQHVAVGLPLVKAAQRIARDGEGEGSNERRALDVGDELRRTDEDVAAEAPHERLDRANDAGRQLDDRLVVDDDLPLLDRVLEVAHDAAVERRPRHDRFVARVALGRVHLAVGAREEVDRGDAVAREERPTDRRVELDQCSLDAVGPPKGMPQPAGERCGFAVLAGAERQDDELVSADARHRVRLPHDRLEAAGDGLQDGVPGLVPTDVVHALEPVEIDDEQRELLSRAPRSCERLRDPVVEELAVG